MVSALRDHGPPLLPWIVHADGTFVTLPDGGFHRGLTFPDSANFIGASKNWLAFYRTDKIDGYKRSYLLYNPFFGTTVPLPELDSVIGQVSNWFEIRKVLMRSAPDDIVAVTTNNWNYPIIVCRPGKPAAWFPGRLEMPYARIFDVVFLGDNLYGLTADEDLIAMNLDEDEDGRPITTSLGMHRVVMRTYMKTRRDKTRKMMTTTWKC